MAQTLLWVNANHGVKKEEEEERAFIDLFLILRVILSTSTGVSPSIFLITELILL